MIVDSRVEAVDGTSNGEPHLGGMTGGWRTLAQLALSLPDRLALVVTDRAGLALLLATMAAVPLVVSPVGEFAVDDDWSYAQAVQHLFSTGVYQRSVWIDTAFVAQAWWGAAISMPFGFSLTGLRLGTLVVAAIALLFFYRLLLRIVSPVAALGVALLLLFHPIFLHLAYTFMTDVPFLTVMLAAIWCVSVALEGDRARFRWLAAGSALVGLTCLVRQVGIALVPAVLFAALPELCAAWTGPGSRQASHQTRRAQVLQLLRHRLRLLAALLLPCALVVTLLAYADPRDVSVEVRFVDIWQASSLGELVAVALKETALASLLLGLSVAPAVLALWLPSDWRGWQHALAIALLLMLAAVLGYHVSAATDWLAALSPLFGNTLSSAGLTTSGLHPRAISVDTTTLTVLVGAALMGAIGLVLALVDLAGSAAWKPHPQPLPTAVERGDGRDESRPYGPFFSRGAIHRALLIHRTPIHRALDINLLPLTLRLLALSAAGILLLTLGYGPVGGPVNGLYDRYLLPVLTGALAVAAYASRGRRAAIPILLAGALLFAGWSLSWQREYMARQAAVWTVAQTMVEAGIPAAEIDAGYEWNGWWRGDAAVERAHDAAVQAGEPRRFVQLVVDAIYAPHSWYVGFTPYGPFEYSCFGAPRVTVPYGDGWAAYGMRRCRPPAATSPVTTSDP